MFSKLYFTAALVFALVVQTQAHTFISPGLGMKGQTPVSKDCKRIKSAGTCIGVDIASNLGKSQVVHPNADGSYSVTVQDFTKGRDGSRYLVGQFSADASGNNFQNVNITQNGNANPTSTGTEPITFNLPQGAKCTGGLDKNLCVAQFTSTDSNGNVTGRSGFGNCVVLTSNTSANKLDVKAAGSRAARAFLAAEAAES